MICICLEELYVGGGRGYLWGWKGAFLSKERVCEGKVFCWRGVSWEWGFGMGWDRGIGFEYTRNGHYLFQDPEPPEIESLPEIPVAE